jgi:hypothetical protein
MALRLPVGWMHRACWLAGSEGRENALRSARDAIGRRLAVADYLLAQQRWGELPVLVSWPKLVAHSFGDAGDNDCSQAHKR